MEFVLKFKTTADGRAYDKILEGTENLHRDSDMTSGDPCTHIKAANKPVTGI